MSLKEIAQKILDYNGPPAESFVLEETDKEKNPQANAKAEGDNTEQPKKPSKKGRSAHAQKEKVFQDIQSSLEKNLDCVRALFFVPLNADVVIREFSLPNEPPVKAFLVILEGATDGQMVNEFILQPLMLLSNLNSEQKNKLHLCKKVLQKYLPSNKIKEITKFSEVIKEVVQGSTVIFLDGNPLGIAVETKGFQHRGIETAKNEQVVQGPQEAFVEDLRSNTSLVRKIIRNENLVTEFITVGARNNNNAALMYLKDLANPQLVAEVKKRISAIKVDYIPEPGILEELIEDHPLSLLPQSIVTERPDRVASMLVEAKVAILLDNSPVAMVVPATVFDLLHSPEDHYVRFSYGLWLRIIRITAVFLTMVLPAFYVAIATFHQEMIPTDLVLSIAAAKEQVPFPTIVELLLMELSFELIREAGVRVPGVIGPTLGIVGTLILGQAAVAASIVSPILIIIVAVTGLASYVIPDYAASFGFRFMRFFFVGLAAFLGFFGISTGLFALLGILISMKSFGIPFFAPIAPRTAPSADVIVRLPVWKQQFRPDYLQPKDSKRQENSNRAWTRRK
ncbi:MAG: spore germination protein [Desulfitobacteriaceae bacterium]|nr:spore germination protein [Desulfitobacteriaceae bacterium]